MTTCDKCGNVKTIHAECKSCGEKICIECFNGFSNCPGCDNGNLDLSFLKGLDLFDGE